MKIHQLKYFGFIVCLLAISCKKYDPYVSDFDYTAVYFASQKPLRTIVAYDQMQFKVGVTLGGIRENNKTEQVTYKIDPTLLTTVAGASGFKLLPANYYTLSNATTMVIPAGALIGDVTVTLNKALFTADPAALSNTYALPLRIVSSTTDSVLRGNDNVPAKDYTVLVVKYISPYQGTYFHKGVENKIDAGGAVLQTTAYTNKDITLNATWLLSTLSLNEVKTTGAGTKTNAVLKLSNNNNTITVSGISGATNVSGNGTYEPVKREFYLNYLYTQGTDKYNVKDTLVLRQAPELDLRFEEW